MMDRERKASARKPAAGATAVLEPPRPGTVPAEPAVASAWEEFFRHASQAQQHAILTLARRQGLVYTHQLPAISNGNGAAPADTTRWNALNHLLTGHKADLDPCADAAFDPVDTGLDARQRQAVARALGSPDVSIILGWPGTGKSRVVAEIVTQAALRGERVLFAAARPAALDCVLRQLSGRDAVCALRLLEPAESVQSLPPALRALTPVERVRFLREQVTQSAVRCRDDAEAQCRQRRQEAPIWPRLQHLVERSEELDKQVAELERRAVAAANEVDACVAGLVDSSVGDSPDRFTRAVLALFRQRRAARGNFTRRQAEIDAALDHANKTLNALDAELASLRPLAQAKEKGRWWTWTWWRATFRGRVRRRFDELATGRREPAQKAAAACSAAEVLRRELDTVEQTYLADLDRLKTEEVRHRQEQINKQQAPLRERKHALIREWLDLVRQIHETLRPAECTAAALAAAELVWQSRCQQDEERCKFAQQWTSFLERQSAQMEERLFALVNVVAATASALTHDKIFGPARDEAFDILVLEEADQITEAEFLKLARRARRWVLIGEPAWEYVAAPTAGARTKLALPGPFALLHKLWGLLHWDPRALPFAWRREGDRLCCALRPIVPEQRRWLESERVADSPDIELRILTLPRLAPALVEVLFPAGMPLAQAKQYISRELQETPVQASGRSACLHEEKDKLILTLGPDAGSSSVLVTLGPGLTECLASPAHDPGANGSPSIPALTSRVEFANAAGWSRAKVVDWAARQWGFRDLGRTVWLERNYRANAWLSAALFAFGGAPATPAAASVTLVPVPSLRSHDGPSRRAKGPPSLPREAAGLEQDLSVARHGDRLPTELRPHLPGRGIVNFLEAQAVVRKLEQFLGPPARVDGAAKSAPGASIAVIAFAQAQVDLIRLLLHRHPTLKAMSSAIELGTPAAFVQREFATVLVSFTRSHNHRVVALAESVSQLVTALTRACGQLFLFADPGTLVRRSQCSGRLEHLDDAASAREAHFAAELVRCLQGQASHTCKVTVEG